jgi:hypothetical protein
MAEKSSKGAFDLGAGKTAKYWRSERYEDSTRKDRNLPGGKDDGLAGIAAAEKKR